MAIYQTVIFFVPRGFGDREEQVEELFSEEGHFDTEKIWADFHRGVSPIKLANSTFGTDNETFWEYYGANDLSIEVNEEGVVQCVRARFDGRGYRQGDLKRILSFAHVLECNLFLPEFKKYIKPNKSAIESLSFLLKRSRAAEYAQS
ncbi:hypothetical protein QFX18_19295 [Saccharophagus degradans]|uniref:hypothetical protein n=1 Tax=Saccharophagus degradans TaxID=86304 RepID=UPI0024781415|nr:hypothetical protein [Saccharophagus degradans]WGO98156.1 hypothetical protein QFX18_19295 [Saccharophagus degradans]